MIERNTPRTPTRLDRLMCGVLAAANVEWRGMNMLILDDAGSPADNSRRATPGGTASGDTNAGASGGGRRISVQPSESVEPSPNTTRPHTASPTNQDATPLTRAMVLESLRQRADERLRRKRSSQRMHQLEGTVR